LTIFVFIFFPLQSFFASKMAKYVPILLSINLRLEQWDALNKSFLDQQIFFGWVVVGDKIGFLEARFPVFQV